MRAESDVSLNVYSARRSGSASCGQHKNKSAQFLVLMVFMSNKEICIIIYDKLLYVVMRSLKFHFLLVKLECCNYRKCVLNKVT